MKKIFAILCILQFICNTTFSQSELPLVYEIKSDTVQMQMLDSIFWQKLEDKQGTWTIDDVRRLPLAGKFHINGMKVDGIDTTGIHTYWQRYRLKNVMAVDAKFSLLAIADYFDVFVIKADSSVVHYRSGWLQDWEKKDGLKSAEFFSGALPIVLVPGEEVTIYDRRNRKDDADFNTSVRFAGTDGLIQEVYIDYVDGRVFYFAKWHLQEAFIIGLIFLSIFISLFFYSIVKEKLYLYFAGFAFFLGINRHYNILGAYTQSYQHSLNKYVDYLGFAWNFIPFFLVQFIRHFFVTKQKYPKWDKFLFWAGLFNVIIGLVVMVIYIMKVKGVNILYGASYITSFGIIPLSIIITCFLYVKSVNTSFRFLAFGALPLMFLYLISIFSSVKNIFGEISSAFFQFFQNNFRLIELVFLCWLILCFMWVLMMRFDKLRKENAQQALEKEQLEKEKEIEKNRLIEKQKEELETQVMERTKELRQSLEDLKATQSQLVQSEKMASLGELTAGIAHEIQNPLNFVNNFSEVSNELIDEMNTELEKGDINEAKIISKDIKQNLEKINHHGKRADAIVKGMLQHSRSSSGKKEPTDINALCDEYLRLSYHGLRAKDKSFNATIKTDFDESIGNINIIPQDIGRVILNLLTNAFYVVDEKKKSGVSDYEPTVSISTNKNAAKVEIKVTDNGNGISQKVLDKIFQPFFTTKPTGQGTGLGLSLAFDIVTKGHGGELKVETKEGEGTEFIILLPV